MNDTSNALTVTPSPTAIQTYEQMQDASSKLAASGLMGPKTTPEMVFGLMLLCQSEGLSPIAAMKRYHIVEGRPSMRADAMQAEFLARGGAIIFHVRTDEMVAATLFADKKTLDDPARERASGRFEAMWNLDCADDDKKSALMVKVSKFSREGEETVIRTFADCDAKGLTRGRDGVKANWKSSPRQMLTARVITEGVRLVNPGLIAGIYSEDETADIVRQERQAQQQMIDAPSEQDIPAILEIIKGYDSELKSATGERRKVLMGLRSDLNCKLADMGANTTPAPENEATPAGTPVIEVIAPTHTDPKPKAQRKPTQEPIDALPGEWRGIVNTHGKGRMKDQTLGQIFETGGWAPKSVGAVAPIVKLFETNAADDVELLAYVHQAAKETVDRLSAAAGTPQEPSKPPEKAKPATTATATTWRDHVMASKHPDWNGKKLGDFDPVEIQQINEEWIGNVDWSRATLDQKKQRAQIALAMADLFPQQQLDLPQKANAQEEPEHITYLRQAITEDGLNRNSFLYVCKKNGWIEGDTIEGITEDESLSLAREWADVSRSVKADQP